MSLLGIIGGALTGLATGGPVGAIAGGVAASGILGKSSTAGSTSPVNATPISLPSVYPTQTILSGSTPRRLSDVMTGIFQNIPRTPTGGTLQLPDSVKVTGSGTSIGPGGSLFATGDVSGTAYFSNNAGTAMTCATNHQLRGYHVNKTTYRTLDGTLVQAGTKCVKNRRRNALNPRALSRAVSRVAAAKKYATMLDRIEIKPRRSRR